MSCRICRRSSCTESFHSLEEQERFAERETMPDDVNTLREMVQERGSDLTDLRRQLEESRKELGEAREALGELAADFGEESDPRWAAAYKIINQKSK